MIKRVKTKYSLGPLERDTIFTGNFSREAKIHTVENVCRFIGVFCLLYGIKIVWWLAVIGVVLVGIVLIPKKKNILVKVW